MTTTATEIPTRWADLMDELCNLRPIKTKAAHKRAIAQIRQLIRIKKRTKDQSDYLDSLSGLVEQYEKALYPVPAHDPIGNLEFLMDQHGMNTSDLGKVIGSKSMASLILNGRRPMSKATIEKLAKKFHVSPAAFFPTS